MNEAKLKVLRTSIRELKEKGVTGIKVELEAQMNRRRAGNDPEYEYCDNCDEGALRCETCDGDDNAECSHCDGTGTIPVTAEILSSYPWARGRTNVDCMNCDGEGSHYCRDCEEGYRTCPECEGDYRTVRAGQEHTNWSDNNTCFRWLMRRVAEKTGTPYRLADDSDTYEATNPFEWMRFARFYYDGSVDSELTFTVPIDNEENVDKLQDVVEAFKELSDAIGTGFDVRGAGMHLALIFTNNCSYPSDNTAPQSVLHNFARANIQLLPALYFLATTNENSRPLRFRRPMITYDSDYTYADKYSAIVYRCGALEFRVFDTCYDVPHQIFDDIVVMANCMKFWVKKYKSPGLEKIAKTVRFGCDGNDKLDRFYSTSTHLDMLNAGLLKLKPSYYTTTEVKQQRKFARTKQTLANIDEERRQQAEVEYQEYADRYDWNIRQQAVSYKASLMSQLLQTKSLAQLRSLTPELLEYEVAEAVAKRVEDLRKRKMKVDKYVADRLTQLNRSGDGEYTIELA